MVLHRHRCGIIYSQAFADYLDDRQRVEGAEHEDELLSLDYIRCATGEQAGSAWCQLSWIPAVAIPLSDRYQFGATQLHIHKQTRNGLKSRGLDHDPKSDTLRILS
jgi:hypothetical protein